jgi:hypothetical protein
VSDDEISNPGLDEAGDDSLVLSDPLPIEGSKHHTEAAIGDGPGDRDGGQEIM